MEHLSLCDVWRVRNPLLRRYTYRRAKPLYQSRLDYWLISNSLQDNVILCDIIPSIYSDHSAILLGLKSVDDKSRGKGYWKFNCALLEDSNYTKELKVNLNRWLEEYECLQNKQLKWELIKYEIRKFSMTFAGQRKKSELNEEKNLISKLRCLETQFANNAEEELLSEIESVQRKLHNIDETRLQGSIVRS